MNIKKKIFPEESSISACQQRRIWETLFAAILRLFTAGVQNSITYIKQHTGINNYDTSPELITNSIVHVVVPEEQWHNYKRRWKEPILFTHTSN